MKKLITVLSFVFMCFMVQAQVQNPVRWEFSSKKVNGTTYDVKITASIEPGWHVYSQTTPEGGPVPTSFSFAKNPLLTLQGTPKEVGKLEQRFEPLFGVDVKQFSDKVVFQQTIQVKGKAKTALSGSVEFMVCNDEMCLPPSTQKFSIALK
jgi:hypothetical protein